MSENAQQSAPERAKARVQSLSDLIFGLALSLGAIALIQHIPTDAPDLTNDIVIFAFSFLIIVGVWLGYTRTMTIFPAETAGALALNLFLLFCVALEPFLFYVLQTAALPFLDFSSAVYGLDTGTMMALLSAMLLLGLREDARSKVHLLSQERVPRLRRAAVVQAVSAGFFLVSVLDVFWVPIPGAGYLRFLLWYIALAGFFLNGVFSRAQDHRAPERPSPEG